MLTNALRIVVLQMSQKKALGVIRSESKLNRGRKELKLRYVRFEDDKWMSLRGHVILSFMTLTL